METQSKKNNITIQDIAEKLNISASTVSRALNDHPKISKKRKDAVLNMALELGYKLGMPNLLVNERSLIIGLILPQIKDGFYGQIYDRVNEFCDHNGYLLVVFTSHFDLRKEQKCFEQLAQLNPLAFIYTTSDNSTELPPLKIMLQKKIPAVAIHESKYQPMVSSFIMDRNKCLSDAINHLAASGVRRLILLIDETTNPFGDDIYTVFEKELEMADLLLFDGSIRSINSDRDFRFLLDDLYSGKLNAEAIITSSYLLALKIQNFLLSKSNPSQSKALLLSLDGHEVSSISKPKISYSDFKSSQMADQLIILLQEQIHQGFKIETHIFSPKLVIQSSSIRL